MNRHSANHSWIALLLGLGLYGSSILHHTLQPENRATLLTGGLPPSAQKMIAGPFAGSAADLNLLALFSIYDNIRQHTAPPPDLWTKLNERLIAAQTLDPWFADIYRLTAGLTAFHEQGASIAVELLSRGADARTWDWELPFMAGYIAHDFLHDDARAYALMSKAIKCPDAPPLAVGLASKFLQNAEGTEASIHFLNYLKASMPAQYRDVIDARIKRLEKKQKNR